MLCYTDRDRCSSSSPTTTSGDAKSGTSTGTSTSSDSDTPSSPTSTLTPVAAPSGFPLGTYSIVAFLDTVATGCTSNNATWTCAPYTDYYSDPQKALTVINWDITGSSGSYKISSKGTSDLDTSFQISRTKTVNMTGSIGSAKGSFECDYGATNLQAYLYTKMARTYPDDTISVTGAANTVWPYGKQHHLVFFK